MRAFFFAKADTAAIFARWEMVPAVALTDRSDACARSRARARYRRRLAARALGLLGGAMRRGGVALTRGAGQTILASAYASQPSGSRRSSGRPRSSLRGGGYRRTWGQAQNEDSTPTATTALSRKKRRTAIHGLGGAGVRHSYAPSLKAAEAPYSEELVYTARMRNTLREAQQVLGPRFLPRENRPPCLAPPLGRAEC